MQNKIDLVILAGGTGSRLKNLTKNLPKPLIKINGIPFLQYLINFYSPHEFDNIYIIAGYKGEIIKKKFDKKNKNCIPIKCIIEKNRKDTWGALFEVKKFIKNDFILINGDSFLNFNLKEFLKMKKNSHMMLIHKNKNYKENQKLSNINIDKKKNIIFDQSSNYMNSGIYFFKKSIKRLIINKKISLENIILPDLIKQKKIKGLKVNGFFIDIGLKKNLKIAKQKLKKYFKKPAIFLDRDGTINIDKNGYTYKEKDLKIFPKIINFLKKKSNYHLFIVTNQSGIGRGKYSIGDFYIFQKKMKNLLIKKNIYINDVKFCPHHKNAKNKYRKLCKFRKPNNGMIELIKKENLIFIKKSFMIGDSLSDKGCAKKSKLRFIFSKKILQ